MHRVTANYPPNALPRRLEDLRGCLVVIRQADANAEQIYLRRPTNLPRCYGMIWKLWHRIVNPNIGNLFGRSAHRCCLDLRGFEHGLAPNSWALRFLSDDRNGGRGQSNHASSVLGKV